MLRVEFYALRVEFYTLRVEFYTLRVEFYTLRVEFYALRVELYALRVEFYTLRVEFYTLRVEFCSDPRAPSSRNQRIDPEHKKRRDKTMAQDFVKRPDREFEAQVAQFLANLGPVKTALGLPAPWDAPL